MIGFKDEPNVEYKDNIDDNNDDDIYRHVIKQWYNFPKHDKWFNNKEISMFDNRLLHEINERWIIDTVNSNNNYSGLEMPEIYDPSMGQSQVIKKIFGYKKNGFFIECGAYDGETRSNTLNLERYYNWTGLLIEADPINFRKMIDKKRRAYLSPTCLSLKPYPMNTSFLMANNIGRIHQPNELTSKIENTKDVAHNGKHVDVQCFPLASYIMALNITSVDYFSLDVEGSEMEVLQTIPFNLVDIKTLSVEYTHVENGKNRMIKFMENNGYYSHSFVKKNYNLANDIIFVK
ncbi:protein Star, partial [Microplitis demolitor]|uniref:protein Star n=1 Tax=Microplitis demolitor TaxID=69319 RepID=UPI0004CDCEF9